MKLKKKTKKRLNLVLVSLMISVTLVSLIQPFLSQNQNSDLQEAYIKSVLTQPDKEPVSDVLPFLEGYYEVVRVVDGDSLVVLWGQEERELHLIGVDAPVLSNENDEPATEGMKAAEYLTELLDGQTVGLEFDAVQEDESGDLLAYVYLEDNTQVNEHMISKGFARTAEEVENVKYQSNFESAEAAAKEAVVGFWNDLWSIAE